MKFIFKLKDMKLKVPLLLNKEFRQKKQYQVQILLKRKKKRKKKKLKRI